MLKRKCCLFLSVGLLACTFYQSSYSCTRVLDAVDGHTVMVGRNMDWYGEMQTNLYVFPRGINHIGSAEKNSLNWKSKYGSIVSASYNAYTSDGMNEKGLAIHLLWLNASDYGQRDSTQAGLSLMLWGQYYLDNFASVNEAVNYTNTHPFQVLPFFLQEKQRWVSLHLAIEDATGDSAIIEYIDGKPKIYHDRAYTILTNDPVYPGQLDHLKNYVGFGGDQPMPGSATPEDRFVRASYYLKYQPSLDSDRSEMKYLNGIMHSAAHPFEPPSQKYPAVAGTIWTVVSDLTHQRYYFKLADSISTVWTDLNKFDLREGASVMQLDLVSHPDISGDVTNQFEAVKK